MRVLSIRARLTLWYSVILALTFMLLAAVLWFALQHSIRTSVDKNLRSRLETVHHYIDQQMRENEGVHLQQELSDDADVVAGGSLLRFASTTGAWIYRSRVTEAWRLTMPERDTLPREGKASTFIFRGQPIRILSAPLAFGVVQIALPLAGFQDMQKLLAWTVFLGSPLLVFIASAGGYWMSSRALKPVNELVSTARSIRAQNLGDRLPSRGTGDELDRLSDTLNEMLARLESAFTRTTRFTADASHELRTPVAIIRTTAEVTRASPRTPAAHEKVLDVILTQAGRMTQLIDDLLLLARADSETQPAPRELMDAAVVLRATCDEMRVIADASGLQLHAQIPVECTFFGDPDDLRRIVLVLLDNAIKYTKPAGLISVSLEMESSANRRMAVIHVRDTGVGIAQDHLPHIFDRFYRAADDRSRDTGGVGLGLTLARYLAERHDGYIKVISTLGAGSTFSLFWPV